MSGCGSRDVHMVGGGKTFFRGPRSHSYESDVGLI